MTDLAGKSLTIEGCMAENGNRLGGSLGERIAGPTDANQGSDCGHTRT
jgi:hypothetical protein